MMKSPKNETNKPLGEYSLLSKCFLVFFEIVSHVLMLKSSDNNKCRKLRRKEWLGDE